MMLKNTDKLILGTAQIGLKYGIQKQFLNQKKDEIGNILQYCIDNGVTSIDTAIGYGDSETIIGSFNHPTFKIFTKIPRVPPHVADLYSFCMKLLEQSFRRLNVNSVEGLLLHYSKDYQFKGVRKFLNEVKLQKLSKYVGCSIYDPNEFNSFLPHFNIDLVQAPLNALDKRILKDKKAHEMQQNGVKLHARSIFLQGLLTAPIETLDEWFMQWKPLLVRWDQSCKSDRLIKVKTCLNAVIYENSVDSLVIGFDSLSQCKEVLEIYKKHLKFSMESFTCDDKNLINPSYWKNGLFSKT